MRIIHRAGVRFCGTHEELYGLRAHSLKVQEVQSLRLSLRRWPFFVAHRSGK